MLPPLSICCGVAAGGAAVVQVLLHPWLHHQQRQRGEHAFHRQHQGFQRSVPLLSYIRTLLDGKNVLWQMAELGKVDQGGGGTIAKFMADRNIDTIDAGVPVLSMHAPFELVSKFDCWMTYRGVLAAYCDTQA